MVGTLYSAHKALLHRLSGDCTHLQLGNLALALLLDSTPLLLGPGALGLPRGLGLSLGRCAALLGFARSRLLRSFPLLPFPLLLCLLVLLLKSR